jgi:hypothetical protein
MFPTERLKGRVVSIYKAGAAATITSGALVDIDLTDISAVNKSIGYDVMVGGTLKLATIPSAGFTSNELGFSIASVLPGGVPIIERILGVATNFMTLPSGLNIPVYLPANGDFIGTSEFVGYNPAADSATTGYIDITLSANYGAVCGVFNGKFRLKQGADQARAIFLHKTTANGVALGVFKMLS